jgi:hypothetical protein
LALRGEALAIVVGVALTGLLSLGVADDRPVYSGSAKVAGPAMLGRKGKRVASGGHLFGTLKEAPVHGAARTGAQTLVRE